MSDLNLIGMPFFPGHAIGKLHVDLQDTIENQIVLIKQAQIPSLTSIPSGLLIVEAGPFSHTMIGVLSLGVPTVLISAQQAELLEEGMELLIDGSSGGITNEIESSKSFINLTADYKPSHSIVLADGEPINLYASVRHQSAANKAKALGAKAIGLVRTEFLIPADQQKPDKTYYAQAFDEICTAAKPLSVTFRLLDIAADKLPGWITPSDAMTNPLGLQGVRLHHGEPVQSVVTDQLQCLAELSQEFDIRVLIPFISRLEEFDYWLTNVRNVLPERVPVGAMAETPASVLDINYWLESADFVAIGCNDLMQTLFAADRDSPELRHYLDPYAPVLYRLLKQVAQQAGNRLNNVRLCGLLAQIQGVLPVLLGLGYRTFSVDAAFIPYLANKVAGITHADCEKLANQVCCAKTTQEVLDVLQLPTDKHPPFLT